MTIESIPILTLLPIIFYAIIFVIVIIAAIAVTTLKKEYNNPNRKGKQGEEIVSYWIGPTKENEQYVINNLYLKNQEGKSCQIDHIVINKNGIFVIETKNYSGIIYGNEERHYWTQSLSYGRKKYKLYNPVKQNAKHIYMLKKVTDIKIPIRSIVVFTQGNIEQIQSENVYTVRGMKEEINRSRGENITEEQMKKIYEEILKIRNTEETIEQEHIENIHKMKEDIEQGICPRCGGRLIERKGQYGIFYGCSNYPKCKFKKK